MIRHNALAPYAASLKAVNYQICWSTDSYLYLKLITVYKGVSVHYSIGRKTNKFPCPSFWHILLESPRSKVAFIARCTNQLWSRAASSQDSFFLLWELLPQILHPWILISSWKHQLWMWLNFGCAIRYCTQSQSRDQSQLRSTLAVCGAHSTHVAPGSGLEFNLNLQLTRCWCAHVRGWPPGFRALPPWPPPCKCAWPEAPSPLWPQR